VTGAACCRVFNGGAKNNAVTSRAKTGIHDDAEQQFGATLTDKELAVRRVHENPHIVLGLGDHADKFMRANIVAALIVRNGGIGF